MSLDNRDYDELVRLGESQRPRLSLQYLVEYAVCDLLRRAQDQQAELPLGDPLRLKADDAD